MFNTCKSKQTFFRMASQEFWDYVIISHLLGENYDTDRLSSYLSERERFALWPLNHCSLDRMGGEYSAEAKIDEKGQGTQPLYTVWRPLCREVLFCLLSNVLVTNWAAQ